MNKKNKKRLIKIFLGGAIFAFGIVLKTENLWLDFGIFLAAYLIIGWDVLQKAVRNILNGKVFDENFLMTIATIGAFAISEFSEGVAVMLFYQVGEFFQDYAVNKSRKSISELMDIRPDYANVLREGAYIKVNPDEVHIGDTIEVKPGEKIPLDATVLDGYSSVDAKALTGESLPQDVETGSALISGCINLSGVVHARVDKEFGESTASRILELVENAGSQKSKSEAFITKFARYYTPAVVFIALALALVPPLVLGQGFSEWVYRGLIFLVVSCPCALVISVPLSFFGGIGAASKLGILVKGGNYLEALSKTELVVFDKTGTLTHGVFRVKMISPVDMEEEELLRLAAYAESYSSHPISLSLKTAYGKEIVKEMVSDVEEIPGHGVQVSFEGKTILAGNAKLMNKYGISYEEPTTVGTVVYVAVGGNYCGYILIADEIKNDAHWTIFDLRKAGAKKIIMMTGDSEAAAEQVAREINIDEYYAQLLPAQKLEKVQSLMKNLRGNLVFVGDGVNDAPVLAGADIGVAMGGLGSDAAIEAADIVIMDDSPSMLPMAVRISRTTLSIVRQNIVFALFVKGLVLVFTVFGMTGMWDAVFADVGVSIIAILNAMRILYMKKF